MVVEAQKTKDRVRGAPSECSASGEVSAEWRWQREVPRGDLGGPGYLQGSGGFPFAFSLSFSGFSSYQEFSGAEAGSEVV